MIAVPAGQTMQTGYVPIEDVIVRVGGAHLLYPAEVERAYRRLLEVGEGSQEWPCPWGEFREDGRFVLKDGRNRYVAALMLGYRELLVAWIEDA